MRVFLAHSSARNEIADSLDQKLKAAGFEVFNDGDGDSLPAGDSYDDRIREAIMRCDVFVYLISPESVRPGVYSRVELELVMKRWPSPPPERVLPVVVAPTPDEHIPVYLKAAVTMERPQGEPATTVLHRLVQWRERRRRRRVAVAAAVVLAAVALGAAPVVAETVEPMIVDGRQLETAPPVPVVTVAFRGTIEVAEPPPSGSVEVALVGAEACRAKADDEGRFSIVVGDECRPPADLGRPRVEVGEADCRSEHEVHLTRPVAIVVPRCGRDCDENQLRELVSGIVDRGRYRIELDCRRGTCEATVSTGLKQREIESLLEALTCRDGHFGFSVGEDRVVKSPCHTSGSACPAPRAGCGAPRPDVAWQRRCSTVCSTCGGGA